MKYKLDENSILYFLHIPKTAGTSLKKILDSQFNPESIVMQESWFHLLESNDLNFVQYQLIRGHYGYGVHHIINKKPIYITMLREPTSQLISWYNHIMLAAKNNNPRISKLFSGNETLSDILSNDTLSVFFENIQTRYLAFDFNPINLLQYFQSKKYNIRFNLPPMQVDSNIMIKEMEISMSELASQLHGLILEDFLNFPNIEVINPKISDERLLSLAKKHLTDMAFFGILEQFDESILMLCNKFGWPKNNKIIKENVGEYKKNAEIPEHLLEKIKRVLRLDYKIYEFGTAVFTQRLNTLQNI